MQIKNFSDLPAFFLSAEGRVQWWNEACVSFTGMKEKQMVHSPVWKAFYHFPAELPAEKLLSAWRAGELPDTESGRPDDTKFRSVLISVEKPLFCRLWTWSRLSFDKEGNVAGVLQLFAPVNLDHAVEDSPLVRLMIDRFPLPVALMKNFHFHLINRAYMDLVRCKDPAEICGKPGDYFIDQEDKARFNEMNRNNHQHIVSGNRYHWRYRTMDGELRYVVGHPTVLSWNNGVILLSTMTDETEIVLREQALLAEQKAQQSEMRALLEKSTKFDDSVFLGEGPVMQKLMRDAVTSAKSDSNIVITGETGTGKSLLARLIHKFSSRSDKPFVSVNCGAIPESLMESEFFGHVKGAFTGAVSSSTGFFGAADGGTLFLDEVGELSLSMQVKLLQAIESRSYTPIGSSIVQYSDVRLICATNRNLMQMIKESSLRTDFFYRIFVVNLHVPPLRERKNDIVQLAKFFFRKFNTLDSEPVIPEDILKKFCQYEWPGNIREMQNVILRYLVTGEVQFFPMLSAKEDVSLKHVDLKDGALPKDFDLEKALLRTKKIYIVRALKHARGNKKEAAALLGLPLRTFQRYCSQLGLMRRLPELD